MSDEELSGLCCVVSLWLLFVIPAGAAIGRYSRGRMAEGVCMGLLFGPIGLLLIPFLSDARAKCPYCRSTMREGASVCVRCLQPFGATAYRKRIGITLQDAAVLFIGLCLSGAAWMIGDFLMR